MSLDIMNLMPKDKEELIECLSQMNNDMRFMRFVAGGTDVLPALEGKSRGFAYIDITHVNGMNAIQVVEDRLLWEQQLHSPILQETNSLKNMHMPYLWLHLRLVPCKFEIGRPLAVM